MSILVKEVLSSVTPSHATIKFLHISLLVALLARDVIHVKVSRGKQVRVCDVCQPSG